MASTCFSCLDETVLAAWELCYHDRNSVQELGSVFHTFRTGDLMLTTCRLSSKSAMMDGYVAATATPWKHGGIVYIRNPGKDGSDVLIIEFAGFFPHEFCFQAPRPGQTEEQRFTMEHPVRTKGGMVAYPLHRMINPDGEGAFVPIRTASGKVYDNITHR